jgi:hypothetical protein
MSCDVTRVSSRPARPASRASVWQDCLGDIGRAPRRDLARLEARVLDYTLRRKPQDGSTHWSSRKLAAQLGVPFMTARHPAESATTRIPTTGRWRRPHRDAAVRRPTRNRTETVVGRSEGSELPARTTDSERTGPSVPLYGVVRVKRRQ